MANGSAGRYCTSVLDDEKRDPAGAGAHATLASECRVAPPAATPAVGRSWEWSPSRAQLLTCRQEA